MQVIAHNMLAQFTNRQLNITSSGKSKSTEKLSSGYRINRAGILTSRRLMRSKTKILHMMKLPILLLWNIKMPQTTRFFPIPLELRGMKTGWTGI